MTDSKEVFCTSCGSRIPEDTPYCSECGAEQAHVSKSSLAKSQQGSHLSLDKEYCSDCGEVIPADVPYCPDCGSDQYLEESSRPKDSRSNWIVGFKPNSKLRNIVVGFLYFIVYPVGIPLLIYGYLSRKRNWSNRKIGTGAISVILALMVSLVAIGLLVDVPEESPQSGTHSPKSTVEETGANGAKSKPSLDVAVRIKYRGDWSGAVSILYNGESSTRSISGTGTTTIPIKGAPNTVSVNSQKQDGSSGTLVVQIIEDGEVISESSTSSEYGVAQTSSDVNDYI